ncbi:MAG: flagellar M-ring protein FliF [Rhodobacteraceae bacterium]|uniref:Flagellar M-ring protein n=1 Tax=Salipiger profundus TaxID=1229727 RepID=A0A1U7D2Y1_9RHOB|nr:MULTISPECIES: flagellar basal-body MS-ring/collar protein FliF [Salipiger]APX22524.1 flagellar M-ring protein FliF [Salipiger profundus]MAB06065.1 flagellar M-ring protein FliF [Paracoccaceae bacterium]GGA11518.1 flagellar M-ring protein [Salipiger profundus]SFC70254.1 flagellar M-ring protein FliF [Salipiger profundus]
MQQLAQIWERLGARRRVIVMVATAAMMISVLAMARMTGSPTLALLYAGLENGAAGEVVEALEQRGVPYEVRGGAIFVPELQRDALRMTLASEGLPANSTKGYELLDGLSGFGTTSQMFDAAYWRAKEGELARTIVASPYIATARVHIANSSANPFQRDVTPTASVSVTSAGEVLSAAQARALKYLVASAVPGLVPENVAVIDGKGGLIGAEDERGSGPTTEDKAAQMRDRVQRLVEARVGQGNAVVELSLDTVTESETIRQRQFDPEGRVVISTDTSEDTSTSQDSGGGDVTVASNLPAGQAGGGGDSSSSQSSETRERVNYEVSETMREVTRVPGAIKRLTVAVLVNGSYDAAADGTQTFVPLPEPQLAALRDLVASAVGFDEERGDEITIRSLPFERPEGLGTGPIEPGWFSMPLDPMLLIQMAILAVVALVLGLFVVRPILSGPARLDASDAAGGALALPPYENGASPALDGELDGDADFAPLAPLAGGEGFGGMGMVDFDAPVEEDPVDRLRTLIEARKDETVEILRSWLDEKEEVQ